MGTKPEISFDYDKAGDVLYITVDNSGEPSYCEEIDDILLVEKGVFSHQIIGFRLMDVSYHKITQVQVSGYVTKALKEEQANLSEMIRKRAPRVKQIPQKLKTNRNLKNILQNRATV